MEFCAEKSGGERRSQKVSFRRLNGESNVNPDLTVLLFTHPVHHIDDLLLIYTNAAIDSCIDDIPNSHNHV